MMTRIVAVVVDTQLITCYRSDGSTFEIPQGDPKVKRIMAEVIPKLDAGAEWAEIDLQIPNAYKDFEEKSGGGIRFFRVAKKALSKLFGADDTPIIDVGAHGSVPSVHQDNSRMAAVQEIVANAEPANHPSFREDAQPTDTHTIVAAVETDKGTRIVPGVQQVRDQIKYGAKVGSTKGMERLLQRMAAIVDRRNHSVQDLLKFLERGDLPVADDGCIVAYKRLYSDGKGRYNDPHTRRVSQTIGSYVCLDEGLVDLNRRNECSNGLHIGRRAYMGGFSGDSMFICKIDPEDVMVVPHGDPNKVRVKGYHILAKLNEKAFEAIKHNRPATSDEETAKVLSEIIAGRHVGRLERVRIHGAKGTDVVITPLVDGVPVTAATDAPPAPVKQHVALDDETMIEPAEQPSELVDPKKLAKNQTDGKPVVGSRQQKAQTIYGMVLDLNRTHEQRTKSADELKAFKKSSKVSWASLGFTQQQVEGLDTLAPDRAAPLPKPIPAPAAPTPKASSPSLGKTGNRRQQDARTQFDLQNWPNLVALKKKAKVGWAALGFNQAEIDLIHSKVDGTINTPAADPTPIKSQPTTAPAKPEPKAKAAKPVKEEAAPFADLTAPPARSKPQIARELFEAKKWKDLHALKRISKKSWFALGFFEKEIEEIISHG